MSLTVAASLNSIMPNLVIRQTPDSTGGNPYMANCVSDPEAPTGIAGYQQADFLKCDKKLYYFSCDIYIKTANPVTGKEFSCLKFFEKNPNQVNINNLQAFSWKYAAYIIDGTNIDQNYKLINPDLKDDKISNIISALISLPPNMALGKGGSLTSVDSPYYLLPKHAQKSYYRYQGKGIWGLLKFLGIRAGQIPGYRTTRTSTIDFWFTDNMALPLVPAAVKKCTLTSKIDTLGGENGAIARLANRLASLEAQLEGQSKLHLIYKEGTKKPIYDDAARNAINGKEAEGGVDGVIAKAQKLLDEARKLDPSKCDDEEMIKRLNAEIANVENAIANLSVGKKPGTGGQGQGGKRTPSAPSQSRRKLF